MSSPNGPPTPPPPYLPPVDGEEAKARQGKTLVNAGLITSIVSLLFCPCVGSLAAGGLAFAGQQTTPAGRRSSLGKLPLLTYILSAVGLFGWTTIFAISAATAPEDNKVATEVKPTTTTEIQAPPTLATAPATTLPVPSSDAELIASLRVAPENDPGTYDRELFAYPDGGTDSRGCNTRSRVLERDSTPPAQVDFPGCKILAGRWVDSYTGTTYENPAEVSIDHLVALKEAYSSGASSWSPATMVAFANDVERVGALRVIGGSGNASKGEKDPAEWKPPLQAAWPDYARSWAGTKVAYGLTADQAEVDALRAMLVAPPPPTPATAAPATTPAATSAPATTQPVATTRAPATTRPATTRPPASTPTAVYYPNCAAARAAGAAPLRRGEPGYSQSLDRDNDGVACE